MQLHRQTTTALPTSPEEAYRQIRLLADRAALVDLVAIYSMAVDDHDLPTVVDCFAPDGTFTRMGSTVSGHDELRAFYRGMMDRYLTTLHVPDSQVTAVDTDAGTGTGVATGHAELALDGRLLMAAYRYDDTYVRRQDRWVFQSRSLRFRYLAPIEELPVSFRDRNRIRLPGTPYAEADLPESLPTWETYGLV